MSIRVTKRADRELLNAEALVGHLVPAGSMFAFLAAHRRELRRARRDWADKPALREKYRTVRPETQPA